MSNLAMISHGYGNKWGYATKALVKGMGGLLYKGTAGRVVWDWESAFAIMFIQHYVAQNHVLEVLVRNMGAFQAAIKKSRVVKGSYGENG